MWALHCGGLYFEWSECWFSSASPTLLCLIHGFYTPTPICWCLPHHPTESSGPTMDQPYYRRINSDIADDLESIYYRLVINSLLNGEFGNGQDVHGSGRAAPQIPDQIENYLQTRQVLILEAKWHCTTSKTGRIMF